MRFGTRGLRPGVVPLADNLDAKLLGQRPGQPFKLAFKWIRTHVRSAFRDAHEDGHARRIAMSGRSLTDFQVFARIASGILPPGHEVLVRAPVSCA